MFSDAMLLLGQPGPSNTDTMHAHRPGDSRLARPRWPRRREAPPGGRRRVTLIDVHREFVSHPDNWPFIALAVGIAGWLLATGMAWTDAAWAAVGLLLFVPQEYFTHVHVLHRPLPRTQRRYDWMYRLHYGHHDHPRRHDLMYMPLWLTLPMMAGNVALLWAVTAAFGAGARAFAAAFGGALVGYLVFEWCHLMCHVPFVPRGRILRHVRTQHLLHHFSDETRGYSVAPWSLPMDRLLRTRAVDDERASCAARSASCRYLGLEAGHPWIARARQRFAARSNGDATCSRLWLLAAAAPRPAGGGDPAPTATAKATARATATATATAMATATATAAAAE